MVMTDPIADLTRIRNANQANHEARSDDQHQKGIAEIPKREGFVKTLKSSKMTNKASSVYSLSTDKNGEKVITGLKRVSNWVYVLQETRRPSKSLERTWNCHPFNI